MEKYPINDYGLSFEELIDGEVSDSLESEIIDGKIFADVK